MKKKRENPILLLIAIFLTVFLASASAILVVSLTTEKQLGCDKSINESFINGTEFGEEYAIAVITNEIIKCKTLPISYAGYNYTLVSLECLNLSK